MAHYKRKRSRHSSRTTFTAGKTLLKRVGASIVTCEDGYLDWPKWVRGPMNNHPAWWDRAFHVRPFRAASRMATRSVLKGADPDSQLFPVWGKPHIYYW